MKIELYDWQEKAINGFLASPEQGLVVKAVTGAGKSEVGKQLSRKVGGRTLVLAHTLPLLDQWRAHFHDRKDVDFMTYQTACKHDFEQDYGLAIMDECHRAVSPVHVQVFDRVKAQRILGLSASPLDSCFDIIGPLLLEVDHKEATICPFTVHFHGIDLNVSEHGEYRRLSNSIKRLMDSEIPEDKKLADALIRKRRNIAYLAERRYRKANDLIARNYTDGRKIMVFCQRKEQADKLAEMVDIYANCMVYHTDRKDNLDDYRSGKVKILISVGMVKEGFDDVDSDCGIVMASATTEIYHVQTMGRLLRFKEGKQADIHILLANGTTDMTILKHAVDYEFELHDVQVPVYSEHKKDYYDGAVWGFRDNDIWRRNGHGREYVVRTPETEALAQKLRKFKPLGGKFTINKNGVFIKVEKEIIKVTDEVPDFGFQGKRDMSKKMTWDELFE